jgi:hypothetical protein
MSDGLLVSVGFSAIVEKRVSSLVVAGLFVLFALSFLAVVPAHAATSPSGSQYVWATLNALGYGNYAGGNEEFTVFVVNSDSPPLGNMSLFNETLTAPALPPSYSTGSAIGLPVQLSAGQAILSTIYLEIPSNFTGSSFTATVAIDLQIANGTSFFSKQLTESTTVVMLGLPGTTTPPSSTTSAASSSQTITQSGGVSSGIFYAGIGAPSVIVIILLALLVRRRGRPQPSPRTT